MELQKKEREIELIVVPGRGHCDLSEEFMPLYEHAAEDASKMHIEYRQEAVDAS